MQLIDLLHLGRERVIGAWRVGEVLIDPGPSSCLATLMSELEDQPPRALALTHIHLDHAGATGSLLARFPEAEVWVHERGAQHLVDPSKLIASAGRLYGAQMQRLWGEILPVEAERIRVLGGGESRAGFRVVYTPGHASHHVSYLHEESGHLFGGDVTGVRVAEEGPVLAPTPPPDIDLDAWRDSLNLIEAIAPTALIPTHFGIYADVAEHLAELRDCLEKSERRAETLTEDEFVAALRADVREHSSLELAAAYEQAVPPFQSFQGLERWLRKRS
jgi:glyoxylase-like metal-dependent hydrolase (beta-lactamase superfamily II)